jgi:Arc/MetJ-type ribon-helix-helix transcriptional regulator
MTTDATVAELEQLVRQEMATGKYASPDQMLLEAVRLLAERNRRRDALRQELQIGRDQLDRGEYTEYDEHSLRRRFEQLKERVQRRVEGKKDA